jgi:hypothetical protein
MKNNGYELTKRYQKAFNYLVIVLCVGFASCLISLFCWHIFKSPILMLIGILIVFLSVIFGFIMFFYAFYLVIRILFAKWPNKN